MKYEIVRCDHPDRRDKWYISIDGEQVQDLYGSVMYFFDYQTAEEYAKELIEE